ncbi:sulfate/molybdate ABC transporter ATP-binding protein [Mycobacterium asiaticum]|uniref:sulfate/molybdate ABC transporter ATP-binding protein n=1 Tax=Mycobacterium asiaticum TaxID=1790 RepID=UPI0007F018CE|nr:sulfate/molybdate ABC transporter ATP-binding protein [Mycobacterium asiaticum]OBJ48746.1 molybdenum ABC transporter ATP-binding protein [Mycobacterium asiaticum]
MSELQLRAVVTDRNLDLEFTVAPGEVIAMLGPNGAGKSTALHVIAGLLRPDSGWVRLGELVLTDTAARVEVPTHRRRVGLLLQDPLLFPHLTVLGNVSFGAAFGPNSRRSGLRSHRASALRWLREVDAVELADRKPRQLSGGQAQRVAIARALAAEPEILLLDEPLSGLDVAAAASIRALLRGVVAGSGCAVILVTHDLLDVLTLADRVLVLESGKIAEIGKAAAVLSAPRSRFGARIAGVNLVSGSIGGDGALYTDSGQKWHGIADSAELRDGDAAVAVFTPASVAVYDTPPHGSPRNTVEVTVAELDTRGPAVLVRAADQSDGGPGLAASITVDAAAELQLTVGTRVWFSVKATEVALHPAFRRSTNWGDTS